MPCRESAEPCANRWAISGYIHPFMVSIVLLMVPLADDQSISIDGHMHPFTVSIMMLLRVQIIPRKSFGGWARLVLGSFLTCSCACADQNDGRQGSAGLSGCDPRRQPRRQGSKDRSAEREGRLSGCRAQNQVAPPINRSVLCGSYPFMDAHIHLWMLIMYPFLGGVGCSVALLEDARSQLIKVSQERTALQERHR